MTTERLLASLLALLAAACSGDGSSPVRTRVDPKPNPPGPEAAPALPADGAPAEARTSDAVAAPLAASTVPIVDRPIRFDAERKRLTVEYRRLHQDPAADSIGIVPKMIVIHHTGGSSAEGTWRYFNRVRAEGARKRLARAGALGVSAHFVVARDGTVLRLMPEDWMARHVIGLNHVAIGVENVGDLNSHPLTDAQLEANVRLIRYLASRHPIEVLIGHHEYRRFEGHPLFLERDPAYRNRKGDPGPAFMQRLRDRVRDLGLRGPPSK